MHYLLFLLLPILSTAKGTSQSYVSKKYVKSFKDNVFLNLSIFLIAAIIFTAIYVRGVPNLTLLVYSLIFAVSSVLFQLSYSLAFKYGSLAITSTIMSFSLVIQVFVGLFFFNEKLTVFNYIAFAPLVASIILMGLKNNKAEEVQNKNRIKWIIFTLLAFIGNAATTVIQIFFNHEAEQISSCTGEFVAWSYILSFAIMVPIFIGAIFINKKEQIFEIDWKNSVAVLLAGITLVSFNFFSTIALNYFPSSIFFPIRSAITIVVLFITDILFYKTKIKLLQWIGAFLAIVAVVFLSI